jgi:SAM-dependent methyltransferase
MSKKSGFIQQDWYDAPLYYDMIFSQGTQEELAFLIACHHKYGLPKHRTVLEPACGSGRLVVALAKAGFRVQGFDLSTPMLAFAQERLDENHVQAELCAGRMEDFKVTTQVALAHCLVSTFKYLLTEDHAVAHLQGIADALLPGGIYVLGFHLSDYTDTRASRERWCVTRGKMVVTCNIQSWPADKKTRTEQVRSRLIVRQGRTARQMETLWPFRTYNAAQVRSLLKKVPRLAHVATYDFGYAIDAPRTLHDEQLDVVLILRRQQ